MINLVILNSTYSLNNTYVGVGKLSTLSTDTAGKLDVLGHDCDTLGMDGTQVGVFKEADEVSLTGLLVDHESRALESEVRNPGQSLFIILHSLSF